MDKRKSGKATPSKRPKWWAVGLKGWVEIRSSLGPLRPHHSSVEVQVTREQRVRDSIWCLYEDVPGKYRMRSTTWLGGAIVGRLKASTFASRAGFRVGNGKARKVSKSLVIKVLKKEEQ